MICPTHQLKNIIGQLYASRQSGPKTFEHSNVQFGWKPIRDLYNNDIQHAREGNIQRVPGLKLHM